jgi:hypothetical protein
MQDPKQFGPTDQRPTETRDWADNEHPTLIQGIVLTCASMPLHCIALRASPRSGCFSVIWQLRKE